MPGLSFLSKKSWHTSNLKNVEKVWLAEQKAEQEEKKLLELQKQLEEERQIQELRQLQAQSQGTVHHSVDSSMDWMYEGPAASQASQQQKAAEEYLLGKIYKPQESKTFELGLPAAQLSSKTDNSWMSKVASKNDTFTRMHEDPFLLIKQEEKKKRDIIISNPIKMERIRATLSKELATIDEMKEQRKKAKKELKKRLKKEKKESKKSNKRKKEEKDDSSSSSGEEDDADSVRDNKAKARRVGDYDDDDKDDNRRQYEKNTTERRRADDIRERHSNEGVDRIANSRYSTSRVDDYHTTTTTRDDDGRRRKERSSDRHDDYHNTTRDDGERRRKDRSDSRDDDYRNTTRDDDGRRRKERSSDRRDDYRSATRDDDGRRRNDRSDSRDGRRESRKRSRSRSHSHSDNERRPADYHRNNSSNDNHHSNSDGNDSSNKRYGLIRAKQSSHADHHEEKNYLGPRPDLLRRKEELREAERQAKLAASQRNSATQSMTEEERLARLAEMTMDADLLDKKKQRLLAKTEGDNGKGATNEDHSGRAVFLSDLRTEVYRQTSAQDVKSRLDQSRYTRQSSADVENGESFLKRP
eukprot:gene4892-5361_t